MNEFRKWLIVSNVTQAVLVILILTVILLRLSGNIVKNREVGLTNQRLLRHIVCAVEHDHCKHP